MKAKVPWIREEEYSSRGFDSQNIFCTQGSSKNTGKQLSGFRKNVCECLLTYNPSLVWLMICYQYPNV